jgi:hypothetical protein
MPPVPKRSTERRRRNKVDLDHVQVEGQVAVPDLGFDVTPDDHGGRDPIHPVARDLYESLRISGQARYYEPADWQRARVMTYLLSGILWSGRPSSMLYAALQRDMNDLLISEAERRRVRMEIDRAEPDTSADDARVAQLDRYRRAAEQG